MQLQPAVPGGTQYFHPCIPPYLQCRVTHWHKLQYQVVCSTLNPLTPLYLQCQVIGCYQLQYQVVQGAPNPNIPYYLHCQVALLCQLQCQLLGGSSNPHIPLQCHMARYMPNSVQVGMQYSQSLYPSAVPSGTMLPGVVLGHTQCSPYPYPSVSAVPGGMQFFPIPIAHGINSKFLFPICHSFCSTRAHTYSCCSIPDGTNFNLWQVEKILCSPYLGYPVSCVHGCHQHR